MWSLKESGSALGSGSGAFNNTTAFDPQDNVTLSCTARSIQGPVQYPYSDAIVTTVRVCHSIILFFASFSGMFLNILILALVAKFKKLQTISFGIALNIVASNIVNTIILFFGFVNTIANRWIFGEHMCRILGICLVGVGLVRTLVLFILVMDRYLFVSMPFAYPKHQKKFAIAILLAIWLISIAHVSLASFLDCYSFQYSSWVCFIDVTCSRSCFTLGTLANIAITPPSLIPIFLYASLYKKAEKAKKAMAVGNTKQTHPWKATITFFIMFVSTFAMTLPNLVFLHITRALYEEERLIPVVLNVFSIVPTGLLFLIPTSDAIVIIWNEDVREVLKQIREKFLKRQALARKIHTKRSKC